MMKIIVMQQIRDSRKNLIGFLHHTDISKIKALTGCNPSGKAFYTVCDEIFSLYNAGVASNKEVSEAFDILARSNTRFRTERFRNDGCGSIFKYSTEHNAYVFYCKGTARTLKNLNTEHGEYVDD